MVNNFLDELPIHFPEELFQTIVEGKDIRIERIISCGHATPEGTWYDQPQSEWVLLLQGAARLAFEDKSIDMKPGDYVNIPARAKHRVDWTTADEPTVWLAVFYESAP